ncbi:MAG: TIGR03986 family CRISPR-associated RAMP protein [Okeania sp. SIO3I5]|uniref:TIGR03986 family type III CRISPR-associated RAMP protein n=1 Tax=Okeania sp. SIO3I5 TaxID=2607805 RepID=UPI0013B6AB50|nr:TIGR03986 family CRISPR-associated RAMP protein [Okeania sp. SIO3I5]NEQ36904.1 TIGR03986 family CRISPR-associated RAMP protein [Okeania sp. SIO3I5]
MNYPKHIIKVPEDRKAIAPYNFVELPDQVIEVKKEDLPDNSKYHQDRNTGKIECILTTSSPLYIRCGMSPENFKEYSEPPKNLTEEEKKEWEEKRKEILASFFSYSNNGLPIIPGSSLRGMLRTLVEIISFSKIDLVSDEERFFFRAVAADSEDPLKDEYTKYLGKQGKNVKAGYLKKEGDNWFIRPALEIDNEPFIWIKEEVVKSELRGIILMKQLSKYRPQYFVNISFENIYTKNSRKFAKKFSSDCNKYEYKGVLVTSGNMMEGATNMTKLNRKNHCIIREPNPEANLIPINENAIRDYCKALTPFQKQDPPFNSEIGVLKNGRAIFYCQSKSGEPVKRFGQSPNFRIPYIPVENDRAASVVDFIPDELRKPEIIDIADAIFGWVRGEKQQDKTKQSRAGRINVSDGICIRNIDDIFLDKNPIIPKILASPKPTTFQHYLVQPEETQAEKQNLKHYASQPIEKTVIRGHKLYWHKGEKPKIEQENLDQVSDTQTTEIKPIKEKVKFEFTIHFENLTNVELGALMWVLDIAQNKDYRLKLGMGKPLGMGAVKITNELYLSDRQKRYKKLFDGNTWNLPLKQEQSDFKQCFEDYMLKKLTENGTFNSIRRIKMLLVMLSWESPQNAEETTRYMEIERDTEKHYIGAPEASDQTVNEYKDRPVLPTPLQVMGIESNCDCSSSNFSENQIISAKIINIEEKKIQKNKKQQLRTTITYEITGSSCEATEIVDKQKVDLVKGDIAKVEIKKVTGNSVRKVKRITTEQSKEQN